RVCRTNRCQGVSCSAGEDCNPSTGECRPNPCLGVVCPGQNEECREGSCYPSLQPDAGSNIDYVAAVGGGCCSVGGERPDGGMILLALLVLLGLGLRRGRGSEADN